MEVIKILGKAIPKLDYEDMYTVPAGKGCVISHINICNADIYETNIDLQAGQLSELNGYDPELTYLEYGLIIDSKTAIQKLKGVTLAAGDTIRVIAANELTTFILFGSEFDQNFEYP